MKTKISIIALAITSFLVLTFLKIHDYLNGFDNFVLNNLINLGRNNPIFWNQITTFGETYIVGLFIILASLIFILFKRPIETLSLISASALAIITSEILKNFFKFARPNESLWLYNASGFSFPSGHTLQATAFFLTLFFLISPFIKKHILKDMFFISISVIIFLIGLSRITLGVHFPSDVFAGFLLGTAISFLVTSLTKIIYPKLNI